MKIIYIKGEFAEAALKINEPDILFSSIASIVKKVIGAGIGEDDIAIHLPELKFFKAYIEDVLEEKITSLEKDKYADTEVKYNGRILHLNIRNHKHRLVDSLIRVYKIVEIEINKSGCLYIYNLSALDNVSTYIVMTVKALNTRETIRFYHDHFISRYPQFGISYDTFESLVYKLSNEKFLMIHEDENMLKRLEASAKTRKINL